MHHPGKSGASLGPRASLGLAAICGAALLLLGSSALRPAMAQVANPDCLWCHGQPFIAETRPEDLLGMVHLPDGRGKPRRPEDVPELYTPALVLESSAHSKLGCLECHGGIDRLPHTQRLAPVSCDDCHREVADAIARGPHNPAGKVDGLQRPACVDCHGKAHEIPPRESPRSHRAALASVAACKQCHDKNVAQNGALDAKGGGNGNGKRNGKERLNPVATYEANVHGEGLNKKGLIQAATCADCHGAHAVLPAANPASPVHHSKAPETCGKCHEGIAEVYYTSVHGRRLAEGKQEPATCTSCHKSHGIGKVAEPFLMAVVEECSHCHLDLGRTYMTSYHGKATSLGDHSVAVCSNCHGAHDILPRADSRSRVAKENLPQTCGKCHEEVNANFVEFQAHADHRNREKNPEVFYTWLGMTVLLLSVLAFFVPHALLWFLREFIGRLRHPLGKHKPSPGERWIQRFSPVHRWTHFLIVISFMGLVATGFPLKYSYAEWAKNLTNMFGGVHVMGYLHRGFAILTFAYAGLHVCFLLHFFARKCPRPRLKFLLGPSSMLFSLRDVKDFFAMARWLLFWGPRPRFDRWTYFEKFDYWGEIWGVLVIGGSGLILWFPTFFTRWLPGWVLNCAMVVHSIEALLAASVIFLVHFINTHLRPDKFPVDMVMLTGSMAESEMKEERGAEYDRLVASGELEKRVVKPMGRRWRILGRIAGILAFLTGLGLIALAMLSELGVLFSHLA